MEDDEDSDDSSTAPQAVTLLERRAMNQIRNEEMVARLNMQLEPRTPRTPTTNDKRNKSTGTRKSPSARIAAVVAAGHREPIRTAQVQ